MQRLCGSGPCSLPRAVRAVMAAYPASYPIVVCASARITVALAPRDVCPRWWRRIQVGLTFSSETPASSLPREYIPHLLATAHPNRSPLRTAPSATRRSHHCMLFARTAPQSLVFTIASPFCATTFSSSSLSPGFSSLCQIFHCRS